MCACLSSGKDGPVRTEPTRKAVGDDALLRITRDAACASTAVASLEQAPVALYEPCTCIPPPEYASSADARPRPQRSADDVALRMRESAFMAALVEMDARLQEGGTEEGKGKTGGVVGRCRCLVA